jgi:hypothetical protein
MKYLVALAAVLCALTLQSARGAEPPAQSNAAPPAPVSPPATEVTPAAPGTAPAPTQAASSKEAQNQTTDEEAQAKRLRGLGWRPEVQNGQTVFCKKEAQLGSRFPTKECGSADVIERRTQEAKDDLHKFQQQNTVSPRST